MIRVMVMVMAMVMVMMVTVTVAAMAVMVVVCPGGGDGGCGNRPCIVPGVYVMMHLQLLLVAIVNEYIIYMCTRKNNK